MPHPRSFLGKKTTRNDKISCWVRRIHRCAHVARFDGESHYLGGSVLAESPVIESQLRTFGPNWRGLVRVQSDPIRVAGVCAGGQVPTLTCTDQAIITAGMDSLAAGRPWLEVA